MWKLILPLFLLAGCDENYRYFCQNPDNFKKSQCQKPVCEFKQTCPEYLVAPVLEKKIEFTQPTAEPTPIR